MVTSGAAVVTSGAAVDTAGAAVVTSGAAVRYKTDFTQSKMFSLSS